MFSPLPGVLLSLFCSHNSFGNGWGGGGGGGGGSFVLYGSKASKSTLNLGYVVSCPDPLRRKESMRVWE